MALPVKDYCRTSCFPVEKRGVRNWFLKSTGRIGEDSAYGEVFQVCHLFDCKYVLKCIQGPPEVIQNEVKMQQKCADADLCKPVVDWWLCNDKQGGAIITSLLQETLFNRLKHVPFSEGKILIDRAVQLIARLHGNGIAHGDSHINNFMLSHDGVLLFIDLGQANHLENDAIKRAEQMMRDYDYLRSSINMAIDGRKLPSLQEYAKYSDNIYGILGPLSSFYRHMSGDNRKDLKMLHDLENEYVRQFITSHIPMEVTVGADEPVDMSWSGGISSKGKIKERKEEPVDMSWS